MKKTGKHILLIRLSSMGDVAMTVPVAEQLRRDNPELKISILTRKGFQDFFRNIPDINFIEFDPDNRHKGFKGLINLYKELQKTDIDCVADLHDVLRTKLLRALFMAGGIPVSHIDKGRKSKHALTRRTNKRLIRLKTTVERYCDTINRLGYKTELSGVTERQTYPLPEYILETVGAKTGKWIGIAPFAKHKGKIYPIPLVDKLISILNHEYDRVYIFGGGTHEKSFAEGMEKRHNKVTSVIGKMTMRDEMALISNLDVMITMDSATMHISSLVGVPVVSVWGATHPYAGFYGYGQSAQNAIQIDMPCRPCSVYGNKPCMFGDYRCMTSIRPETIADAARRNTTATSAE